MSLTIILPLAVSPKVLKAIHKMCTFFFTKKEDKVKGEGKLLFLDFEKTRLKLSLSF